MEDFIILLQSLDPLLIYAVVFGISFIENVFPPSPSDIVVVFAGSLVGLGRVGFAETLLCATAGGCIGFVVMYKVGDWFGDRILERGKIKFIPVDAVRKVESWFAEYGFWIIIANRFLAGTRAVVSFFAGLSKLDLLKTTVLSFISALVWYVILIEAGNLLGQNWQRVGFYLSTYSEIVTAVIVLVLVVWLVRYFYTRTSEKG